MKFLLVLALAGCSKQAAVDDPRPACVAAIDRSVDLSLSKRQRKGVDGEVSALAPKMKSALAELCVADAWSADVVSCFQTAEDTAACRDKLKPEQRQRFVQETMKVRGDKGTKPAGGHTLVPLPNNVGSGSGP
jgi:hypothetical protein